MSKLQSMFIGITGTPGTGKTSVTNTLKSEYNYQILDLNNFIQEYQPEKIMDPIRDSLIVDTEILRKQINSTLKYTVNVPLVIDGHLSHYVVDNAIVLRAPPEIIEKRLALRNYSESKVTENVEAEILDVILVEAFELCENVFEIDTSGKDINTVAMYADYIISGLKQNKIDRLEKFRPGNVDWTERSI